MRSPVMYWWGDSGSPVLGDKDLPSPLILGKPEGKLRDSEAGQCRLIHSMLLSFCHPRAPQSVPDASTSCMGCPWGGTPRTGLLRVPFLPPRGPGGGVGTPRWPGGQLSEGQGTKLAVSPAPPLRWLCQSLSAPAAAPCHCCSAWGPLCLSRPPSQPACLGAQC